MHKPIVFNRHLNEKWSSKNNEIMIKKLNNIKPKVNIQCPESFFFYKKIFNRTTERNTKMQQYEIKKNNEAMFHKLIQAASECHSNDLKRRTPRFAFKKNVMTGTKKFEIIRVAQENQHLYKRLTERGSFYRVDQWERDFLKNQYYKSNHCIYPVINFCHTENSNPRYKSNAARYYRTSNTFASEAGNTAGNDRVNTHEDDKPKVLYKKTDYILHLDLCFIEFSVQFQSFLIKVETQKNKENGYSILFDTVEGVEKIQKRYTKYDEMIEDLHYDAEEDLVKFSNAEEQGLKCKYARYALMKEEIKGSNKKQKEQAAKLKKEEENEEERQRRYEQEQREREKRIEEEDKERQRMYNEEEERQQKLLEEEQLESHRLIEEESNRKKKEEEEEERQRRKEEEEKAKKKKEDDQRRIEKQKEEEQRRIKEEQEVIRRKEQEEEDQRVKQEKEEAKRKEQEEEERREKQEEEIEQRRIEEEQEAFRRKEQEKEDQSFKQEEKDLKEEDQHEDNDEGEGSDESNEDYHPQQHADNFYASRKDQEPSDKPLVTLTDLITNPLGEEQKADQNKQESIPEEEDA